MPTPALIAVRFLPEEYELVMLPVAGKVYGGTQRLLADIKRRTNRSTRECVIRPQDVQTIRDYARHNGGHGGWQRRFAAIEAAIDRSLRALAAA